MNETNDLQKPRLLLVWCYMIPNITARVVGYQYVYVAYYKDPVCEDKTEDTVAQHKKGLTETKTTLRVKMEDQGGSSHYAFKHQLKVTLLISVAVVIALAITCVGINCMVSRLNKIRQISHMKGSK